MRNKGDLGQCKIDLQSCGDSFFAATFLIINFVVQGHSISIAALILLLNDCGKERMNLLTFHILGMLFQYGNSFLIKVARLKTFLTFVVKYTLYSETKGMFLHLDNIVVIRRRNSCNIDLWGSEACYHFDNITDF